MPAVDSELLRPTLAGHRPRDWSVHRPWRLASQVYVGLVGGPLAILVIAAVNAQRLGMDARGRALVVATGLAGLVAGLLAAVLVPGDAAPRLLLQLAGVATYGGVYLLQRTPDRIHTTFSPHANDDEDYESLWGPGLAAVVGAWIVQAVLVTALGTVA